MEHFPLIIAHLRGASYKFEFNANYSFLQNLAIFYKLLTD